MNESEAAFQHIPGADWWATSTTSTTTGMMKTTRTPMTMRMMTMMMMMMKVLLLLDAAAAQQRGLFPAIFNLASNAVVSSNATCGDPRPEVYCKLVEHVPGQRLQNPHCARCHAHSLLPRERHPITNAIDGTNRWWQSPSIKNGRQFHWVTITLDLQQVFQVAYIIIKAANSPRPGNWILERSVDGVTFDPWQFYAISDSECLTRYSMAPTLGPPTYRSDSEVICTSYYSRLNPLEHGEIHTSLINGRPGADDLTSDLLNFGSARYIRLRLQRIRTLNADLMTLSTHDPRDIDPIVTRRYFYSIKDISVGGMCICYGHAQSCPLDPVTKKLRCVCEHNTCGETCNRCCPEFNQQPWQPGTVSEGNTCQKCNCHNKASSCYYNQTVADLSLSVDAEGQRRGGGVCVDCQQDTAGINCDACRDGYYRPAGVSPLADAPCVQCDCDLRGSQLTSCSQERQQPGQCECRRGFSGRRCDRCSFGFSGFPLCSPCQCLLAGSTNSDPCDPCTCKANVMGAHCDLCRPGFFNLQASNPLGCSTCFCFGVSDVCESSHWTTAQVLELDAWLRPPPLHATHWNELPGPGHAPDHAHQHTLLWEAPDVFLGNKLLSYGGFLNLSLAGSFDSAHCDLLLEGSRRSLRLSRPASLASPSRLSLSVAVTERSFLEVGGAGGGVARDDLLTLLADVTRLQVELRLNGSMGGVMRLQSVSLDVADPDQGAGLPAIAVETCECPWGYSGTSCEVCLPGFFRVGGVLFGGNCLQCECNDHGSRCDSDGVCQDCTHNSTGPHCEHCLPGFYGDATEGTADDCRPCPCPLTLPSNSFSPTCVLEASGQVSCDQCQEGYTGNNCERCASGFYGNPQEVGGACVRCQCHGNVDVREAGHCDVITGACLRCLGNSGGTRCQVCRPGYHGDAVHAKNCSECGCDVRGSASSVCNAASGQCECREKVIGRTCDRCQSGFFGLLSGRGCQPCNCSQSGSLSESCDERGRCQCMMGVAGDKCDHCARGYYGFHGDGCSACTCEHTGGNCDPHTGVCVCPAHTEGDRCDRCESGHWGHDPTAGCQSCNCSEAGSSAPGCHLTNGQCPCREGFGGKSCDRCAPGHRGYPACTACGCDITGTDEAFCNRTLGVCECGHTGECVCKVGVTGRRCQECVIGRFGLSADVPDGCSSCFCAGVTSDCEEAAGLTWSSISPSASDALLPLVSQSDLRGVVTGVYLQGGDVLLDTRDLNGSRLAGALYWRLPANFQGPQLLSYGGWLSYVVQFHAEDGSGLANQEPQVLMRGGTLRKLVIYCDAEAPPNGVRTQRRHRMMEHGWRYFNSVSERSVSRADFLSVLSDLEYVIVKASYGSQLQQSRISNVTLETAVEAEPGSEVTRGVASLIESCLCPSGYAGLSCQECAPGFFRQPLSELAPPIRRSLFVRPCIPCRCNNHSQSCDVETGACQDCQHHTSGRSCELCAPGHYGKVSGSVSDCSPCACPLQNNSFSATCVPEGLLGDFRCTACQPGYEGRYCERCSAGHYGAPWRAGGHCSPCSCSGRGSEGAGLSCHPVSGQCHCRKGFSGQSCDQCDVRHVLEGGDCVACDDSCSGPLLDQLDLLDQDFLSLNLSALRAASQQPLLLLEQQSRELQGAWSGNSSVAVGVARVEDELGQLTSDLSTALEQVGRLSARLEEVGVASVSQGSLLLRSIGVLQENIHVLRQEAESLNRTVQEEELSWANQTLLLEEAAAAVKAMRASDLAAAYKAANQESSLAHSLLHSVHTHFLSEPPAADRLRPLAASLSEGERAVAGLRALVGGALRSNARTHALLEDTHARLHTLQSLRRNVSGGAAAVDSNLEAGQLLLGDALDLVEELTNSSAQVELLLLQVAQCGPPLRRLVEALVLGLKEADALEQVYRAESHAQQLHSHAHSLQSSLAAVCNASRNSSRLVELDDDIMERVGSAQQLASLARSSAYLALNLTGQSERSLSEEGVAKLNISRAVWMQSRQVNQTAEALQFNMAAATRRVGVATDGIHNLTVLLHQPITELHHLQTNTSSALLRSSHLQAAVASSSLRAALQRLHTLDLQLQNSSLVVAEAGISARAANQLVTHMTSAANEAQRKLSEAELRSKRLLERVAPLGLLGESLGRNLSDIRELIQQARRQAASIKVAVAAERRCVRTFRPQSDSSNWNSVSVTVRTNQRDGLLFYLGSNTTVDFLAVEVHDGKASLLWDLGTGSTRLDFPHLEVSTNQWTRINATRLGNLAHLSVQRLEAESVPAPAVWAWSPGAARILDMDQNTWIHIGGLRTGSQGPALLRSPSFQGCLGDASLDERNIGLWSYDSREGECGGCFSSPQVEETSFHFDGSGFSLVQKSLRATSTSVVLLFKTLSPGGLLLYLASNNTRDFLSLELVEGRVRLTFDLGSGALVLTSNRKYNTGVWYKITLQRNKRKGYLSIMAADQSSQKEVLEAESPGSASDLNRSDLDPIYVGGLPASRPIRRQVASRSYVGCIKNVEIARSNFDLLSHAYGVRKGCVLEAVRSVSLLSAGFLQLPLRSLGPEAELLLSFTTNNQSGLLLAAMDRQHLLVVHLAAGVLEAELSQVGGASQTLAVTKADGGTLGDGSKHSVIIGLHRKSLSLQVDEGNRKSVSLQPSGSSHWSKVSFFIGGLPKEVESRLPIRLQRSSGSFRGCIQHLVVGGALVDLSGAERYKGVELDRCLLKYRDKGVVLPDEQEVEPTNGPAGLPVAPPTHLSALTPGALTCVSEAEPALLPAAVQFGSSRHSHMTFVINPNSVRRSLSVGLWVRTRTQDGLLLLLADAKLADLVVLRLAAGRVWLTADMGRGPASVLWPAPLSDGQWHHVTAEVGRRSLSLAVDEGASPAGAALRGNQLDVDRRLYLGGLPANHSTRRLNVSSGFQGCVRSLSLNGAALDLRSPASHHNVTSCFASDQAGSYFNGSGYAVLVRSGYKVGADMSVSLEFRTSQSEAVILGVSSAKVDAIGLELTAGQVAFHVNNGAGRLSVRSQGAALCDGLWHHLLARKSKHALTLSVDGRSFGATNPYPQSTSAETSDPVYLGGFPAGVKQNCLSSSSRFRGCLRNLQLIKPHLTEQLDLSSAHFLLGVTPNSCPNAVIG